MVNGCLSWCEYNLIFYFFCSSVKNMLINVGCGYVLVLVVYEILSP